LKANKVNLFVSSVLFVFWYHSPNFLDTPRILSGCRRHRYATPFPLTERSLTRLKEPAIPQYPDHMNPTHIITANLSFQEKF
jgi:hypothetical protein